MKSADVFDRGLAIGSYDAMDEVWIFRFKDELFRLRRLALEARLHSYRRVILSDLENSYFKTAKIEDIRKAMEFE